MGIIRVHTVYPTVKKSVYDTYVTICIVHVSTNLGFIRARSQCISVIIRNITILISEMIIKFLSFACLLIVVQGIGLQRFSDFSNFLQSVLNDGNAQKRSLPVESMFDLQFDDDFYNW